MFHDRVGEFMGQTLQSKECHLEHQDPKSGPPSLSLSLPLSPTALTAYLCEPHDLSSAVMTAVLEHSDEMGHGAL